jgi:hypothetical protein
VWLIYEEFGPSTSGGVVNLQGGIRKLCNL